MPSTMLKRNPSGFPIATAGIPWNTPGGKGIGTDVLNRSMFELDWAKTVGPNDPVGMAMPAIALTGFAGPEDRRRALQAGFQSHMAKPVDPRELISTIATLLGRSG